jgi:hypothetical protein
MRRTDNARIIDTRKHKLIKSALKKKQTVRIRRKTEDPDSGCIELQHRQLLGKLPVAYTCAAILHLLFCISCLQQQLL